MQVGLGFTDNVITCDGIDADRGAGVQIQPNVVFRHRRHFVAMLVRGMDAGMNHRVVDQVLGIHRDMVDQIAVRQLLHFPRIVLTINHQLNGVMLFCISAHRATDGGLAVIVRRFLDVDKVISRHVINGDIRLCIQIGADGFGFRMRDAVPCRIRRGNRNRKFRMSYQLMAVYRNAIAQPTARQRDNRAVNHRPPLQLQGNHITHFRIHAGHGTGNLRDPAVG